MGLKNGHTFCTSRAYQLVINLKTAKALA
jgi:hypothetical protein